MSTYFIGDIHGCYKYLTKILNLVKFNPKKDSLHCTGDLVSKGPNSLEVLRLMYQLKNSATIVLGNHDLYLLKTYYKMKKKKTITNFHSILNATDIDELMNWLRHQPILYINNNQKILMTHAGIHPHWNLKKLKKNAKEIESYLINNDLTKLFTHIRYNIQDHKSHMYFKKLKNIKKNIDIFTTMRYIYSNGELNIQHKDILKNTPKNIFPWFELPRLIDYKEYNVIFGHWSTLNNSNIKIPSGIYGLDSGCCWGGELTILCWENKKIIQIPCN